MFTNKYATAQECLLTLMSILALRWTSKYTIVDTESNMNEWDKIWIDSTTFINAYVMLGFGYSPLEVWEFCIRLNLTKNFTRLRGNK